MVLGSGLKQGLSEGCRRERLSNLASPVKGGMWERDLTSGLKVCAAPDWPMVRVCGLGVQVREVRPRQECSMGHRSRSPVDRVLSECKVHGTRKVVNYTVL